MLWLITCGSSKPCPYLNCWQGASSAWTRLADFAKVDFAQFRCRINYANGRPIIPGGNSIHVAARCSQSIWLPGAKICLAYSGGLDSTVLLHALRQCAVEFELRAIHVDHGLQAASAGWAATCAEIAEQTGVAYSATRVSVDAAGGKGIEAAARAARYQALRDLLEPDEVLVTAHHQRDQVETLLLQMLRGAGVHGLAAMPVLRVDNGLNIFRPLLTVSADAIRAYGCRKRAALD